MLNVLKIIHSPLTLVSSVLVFCVVMSAWPDFPFVIKFESRAQHVFPLCLLGLSSTMKPSWLCGTSSTSTWRAWCPGTTAWSTSRKSGPWLLPRYVPRIIQAARRRHSACFHQANLLVVQLMLLYLIKRFSSACYRGSGLSDTAWEKFTCGWLWDKLKLPDKPVVRGPTLDPIILRCNGKLGHKLLTGYHRSKRWDRIPRRTLVTQDQWFWNWGLSIPGKGIILGCLRWQSTKWVDFGSPYPFPFSVRAALLWSAFYLGLLNNISFEE